MPALPAEEGVPAEAEFPSRAVAPPKSINLGPMYPGVPSSPTGGTAVKVCPHLGPGPSSFFSMIAFTTVYAGAHRGPGEDGRESCSATPSGEDEVDVAVGGS